MKRVIPTEGRIVRTRDPEEQAKFEAMKQQEDVSLDARAAETARKIREKEEKLAEERERLKVLLEKRQNKGKRRLQNSLDSLKYEGDSFCLFFFLSLPFSSLLVL